MPITNAVVKPSKAHFIISLELPKFTVNIRAHKKLKDQTVLFSFIVLGTASRMAQPLNSSGVLLSQETQLNSTLEKFSAIEVDTEKVLEFLGLTKYGFA